MVVMRFNKRVILAWLNNHVLSVCPHRMLAQKLWIKAEAQTDSLIMKLHTMKLIGRQPATVGKPRILTLFSSPRNTAHPPTSPRFFLTYSPKKGSTSHHSAYTP